MLTLLEASFDFKYKMQIFKHYRESTCCVSDSCMERNFSTHYFVDSDNFFDSYASGDVNQSLILVADSYPDNLELISQLIADLGYFTITVSDGEHLLEKALVYKPALILLELMLPVMDGLNCASYLRRNGNLVPIIALTTLPKSLFEKQAFFVGCNEYIEKPFEFERLEAVITHYLRKSLSAS
jgi:CheY-like chemotaxis protein